MRLPKCGGTKLPPGPSIVTRCRQPGILEGEKYGRWVRVRTSCIFRMPECLWNVYHSPLHLFGMSDSQLPNIPSLVAKVDKKGRVHFNCSSRLQINLKSGRRTD